MSPARLQATPCWLEGDPRHRHAQIAPGFERGRRSRKGQVGTSTGHARKLSEQLPGGWCDAPTNCTDVAGNATYCWAREEAHAASNSRQVAEPQAAGRRQLPLACKHRAIGRTAQVHTLCCREIVSGRLGQVQPSVNDRYHAAGAANSRQAAACSRASCADAASPPATAQAAAACSQALRAHVGERATKHHPGNGCMCRQAGAAHHELM